jgi:hypothetical protein
VSFGSQTADQTRKELSRLEALKLPGGKAKGKVKEVLAALRKGEADATATSDKTAFGDFVALEPTVKASAADFHRADTAARQLGSKQCGRFQAELSAQAAAAAPAASKAGFIAKADAVCVSTAQKLDGLVLGDNPSDSQIVVFEDQLLAVEDKQLAQLRALPQPSLDKPALEAWLTEMASELDAEHHFRDAFAAHDRAAAKPWLDKINQSTLEGKADAYGVHQCGSQPTPPA